MSSFAQVLATNAVAGCLGTACVWALSRTPWLRRRPSLLHILWLLVLFKLVTPPLIELPARFRLPLPANLLAKLSATAPVASELRLHERDERASASEASAEVRRSENNLIHTENGGNALPFSTESSASGTANSAPAEPVSGTRPENTSPGGISVSSRIDTAAAAYQSSPDSAITSRSALTDHRNASRANLWYVLLWCSLTVSALLVVRECKRARRVWRLLRNYPAEEGRCAAAALQVAQRYSPNWRPKVVIVDASISPLILATSRLRPTIVLPDALAKAWSDDRLRHVIGHELAHHLRRDHVWATAAAFVTALCWWNPVAWIARRQAQLASELACDAMAIQRLALSRKSYAESLLQALDFVGNQDAASVPWVSNFGDARWVRRRIQMVANRYVRPSVSKANWCLVILCAVALFFGTLRAQNTPPNSGILQDERPDLSQSASTTSDTNSQQIANAYVRLTGTETQSDRDAYVLQKIALLKADGQLEAASRIEQRMKLAGQYLQPNFRPEQGPEMELHVVTVVEGVANAPGTRPTARVHVTHTGAPVILCLTSPRSLAWEVSVGEGVELRQIILGGHEQFVSQVPPEVSVVDYSRPEVTGVGVGVVLSREAADGSMAAYDGFVRELQRLTNLAPTTFLGVKEALLAQIVVGPENSDWRQEQARALTEGAFRNVSAADRLRIWRDLEQLRFRALYWPNELAESEDTSRANRTPFAAQFSVLGPLDGTLSTQEHDSLWSKAGIVRSGRDGSHLRLYDVAADRSFDVPETAERPLPFERLLAQAYDTRRERWWVVGFSDRGPRVFAFSESQGWSALGAIHGQRVFDLCYVDDEATFFAVVSADGQERPELELARLDADGAIVAIHPIGGMRAEVSPDSLNSVQLRSAGEYLAVVDASGVSPRIAVLRRTTGELVYAAPITAPAKESDQLAHAVENLPPSSSDVGHLAATPAVPTQFSGQAVSQPATIKVVQNEQNGHYYELRNTDRANWKEALKLAESCSYQGLPGYLVTITSPEENDFLTQHFGRWGLAWAGGTDEEQEGVWKWVCGPEAGQVFYRVGGAPTSYHNWSRNGDFVEPNNSREREHYLAWNSKIGLQHSGRWNDLDGDLETGFVIIEYSPATASVETGVNSSAYVPKSESRSPQEVQAKAFTLGWNDTWEIYGYAPEGNQWFTWRSPGVLAPAHVVTVKDDDRIAVFSPGQRETGWLFSLASGTWTVIPPFPNLPISDFEEVRGSDIRSRLRRMSAGPRLSWGGFVGNVLFVCGAHNDNAEPKGKTFVAVLNLDTMAWKYVDDQAPIVFGRTMHGATASGVVVLTSTPDSELTGMVWSSTLESWRSTSRIPIPLENGGSSITVGEQVAFVSAIADQNVVVYHPQKNTWTILPDGPLPVSRRSALAAGPDWLFVWSGSKESGRSGSVFDLGTNSWRQIPAAPLAPRFDATATRVGNRVIVFGGWTEGGVHLPDGAVYDLESNSWTRIADIPSGSSQFPSGLGRFNLH